MATRLLTLRHADARDIAIVDALMLGAFDPRYGEAWTRSQCIGVMAMPGIGLTLACADDEPAGFAMIRSVMDEAELLLLAVAPDQRRRGVGAALLRGAVADAQMKGVAKMHLEVRADNDAVRLYLANGFAKVGERRGYYCGRDGRAYDAHTYSRIL